MMKHEMPVAEKSQEAASEHRNSETSALNVTLGEGPKERSICIKNMSARKIVLPGLS